MALPKYIVSEFTTITRYDLASYLNDYVDFIESQRQDITDYYSGAVDKPNTSSFNALTSLLGRSNELNNQIEIHRDRFNNASFWELVNTLSDIQITLETVDNSSKWLRSSITKNNFSPQVEVELTLKQFQTLEQLAKDIGSNDKESDWATIALRNDLPEEGYTPDGGIKLNVQFSNKFAFFLRSVVDNLSGEKVYGIDVDRTITFTNNDLKALTYKETIYQSVEILSQLRQGDTPEFPQNGISEAIVVGANRASIAYPVLFRQLYNTFRTNDSLKNLRLNNIGIDGTALRIDFQVQTRLEEVLNQSLIF